MQRRFEPVLIVYIDELKKNVFGIFPWSRLRKYEFWSLGKIPEKYSVLLNSLEKERFLLSDKLFVMYRVFRNLTCTMQILSNTLMLAVGEIANFNLALVWVLFLIFQKYFFFLPFF